MGGRFFGVNFLTGVLYKECTGVQYLYSLTAHRGIVHMGTHRVHRGTQGYTGVHRGTQGYSGVLRGTQGYTANKLYILYTVHTGVQRSAQAESLVRIYFALFRVCICIRTRGSACALRCTPMYPVCPYVPLCTPVCPCVPPIVTKYEVRKVRCGATYCTSTHNTPYSTV